jgi:hypothetical protein
MEENSIVGRGDGRELYFYLMFPQPPVDLISTACRFSVLRQYKATNRVSVAESAESFSSLAAV